MTWRPALTLREAHGHEDAEVEGGAAVDLAGGSAFGYQDVDAELHAMDSKFRRGGRGGGGGRGGRQGSGTRRTAGDQTARDGLTRRAAGGLRRGR